MIASSFLPERIAVFDLDRTLIMHTSGEIQLIRYLWRKRMLPPHHLVKYIRWMATNLPFSFSEAVVTNKMYLAGLDVKEVKSLLPAFFEAQLFPRLSRCVQDWMQILREKAYDIILLSATLDCILEIVAERLGVDHVIASRMEIRDGKYTGRILGDHPYHHGKVRSLRSYLGGRYIDFAHSYGFGDSWADVPLLQLFGNPVAVNPGFLLKREAKRRHWMIIGD